MSTEVKEKTAFKHLMDAAVAYQPEGKDKFKAQGKSETDAEFMSRLVRHIGEMPEEQYNALPEDTVQAWFVKAAESYNESNPIEPPEGFTSAYRPPAAPKEKQAAAPKEPKQAAAPKEPKERKERKRAEVTKGGIIRRALIEDQSVTMDELRAKLATAGFHDLKPTTLSSYVTDTLETLRIAVDMGKFKPSEKRAS